MTTPSNKFRPGSKEAPTEPFKRSVTSCLRAIARKPDAILMEDKASGQSLLQDLKRETQLPLIPCMPKVDKLTRVQRITPLRFVLHCARETGT